MKKEMTEEERKEKEEKFMESIKGSSKRLICYLKELNDVECSYYIAKCQAEFSKAERDLKKAVEELGKKHVFNEQRTAIIIGKTIRTASMFYNVMPEYVMELINYYDPDGDIINEFLEKNMKWQLIPGFLGEAQIIHKLSEVLSHSLCALNEFQESLKFCKSFKEKTEETEQESTRVPSMHPLQKDRLEI